jgi:hypothetical protein
MREDIDDPDSSCDAQWCSAMMLSREIIGWALDCGNAVQPLSRPVLQLPRVRVPGPHGVRSEEDRQCAMTRMTTCQSSCPRPVADQQGERLFPPLPLPQSAHPAARPQHSPHPGPPRQTQEAGRDGYAAAAT